MKSCTKCKELKPLTEFSKNKTKISGYQSYCKNCEKEYRKTNADKRKEYYQANKENHNKYVKKYCKANRDTINKRISKRRANDPLYKLTQNTRSLIRVSIKNNGYTKKSKTHEILGCSYEQFKQHIEQKFTEGMSWDNRHLWHLDHIIPQSLGLTEEEILALNHYTNFQPLWAEDNIQKSNNIHWTKCTDKYK